MKITDIRSSFHFIDGIFPVYEYTAKFDGIEYSWENRSLFDKPIRQTIVEDLKYDGISLGGNKLYWYNESKKMNELCIVEVHG